MSLVLDRVKFALRLVAGDDADYLEPLIIEDPDQSEVELTSLTHVDARRIKVATGADTTITLPTTSTKLVLVRNPHASNVLQVKENYGAGLVTTKLAGGGLKVIYLPSGMTGLALQMETAAQQVPVAVFGVE